jgi:hypothetical protein
MDGELAALAGLGRLKKRKVRYEAVDDGGMDSLSRKLSQPVHLLKSGGSDGAGAPGEGPDQLMLRLHL